MGIVVIIFAVFMAVSLAWIRCGHGGRFGEAIRWSDWHAWRAAVDNKERELAELMAVEPNKPNTTITNNKQKKDEI